MSFSEPSALRRRTAHAGDLRDFVSDIELIFSVGEDRGHD